MTSLTTEQVRNRVGRYFSKCRSENLTPTPAGLALALDMRTSELSLPGTDEEGRQIIDRALQRIEAETLDLLISKSGTRGLEIILQKTEKNAAESQLNRLSDDELGKQLIRLARRIDRLSAVEQPSGKEDTE